MENIKNKGAENSAPRIRVATFNIGDYSTASGSSGDGIANGNGTAVTKEEYIAVFKKAGADLWGLQEDSPYFNGTEQTSPYDEIYSAVHKNYKRNFTGTYNGKAFLSDYELYDVEPINYVSMPTSYSDKVYYAHPWFLTGKIKVEGKEIAIATLHFDWQCIERRANQIAQVIEFAKKNEYCIIIGDVNPDDNQGTRTFNEATGKNDFGYVKVSGNSTHVHDNKFFTDAGFTPANCGAFGEFYTIMNHGVPRGESPCDNIFVTPNIKILNAEPIYEPWMNDHAIVVADLEIN